MYKSNNGKFKEGIVWWDTSIDPSADVDIFFFIHDYDNRAKNSYGFKTLEINLEESVESIFSGFKSNLRNELRKSEKDFKFIYEYISHPSDEDIKHYVEGYNSFANFKGLQNTSVELIKQMAYENKIVFSKVLLDGALLSMHSHYVATGRTRLYQSFSTDNDYDGKTNALANKSLTFSDIKYFKEQGLKTYDFGGIGNVDGDNSRFAGIIKFKKQFGGEEVILWKGSTPNGARGKEVYDKYFK